MKIKSTIVDSCIFTKIWWFHYIKYCCNGIHLYMKGKTWFPWENTVISMRLYHFRINGTYTLAPITGTPLRSVVWNILNKIHIFHIFNQKSNGYRAEKSPLSCKTPLLKSSHKKNSKL